MVWEAIAFPYSDLSSPPSDRSTEVLKPAIFDASVAIVSMKGSRVNAVAIPSQRNALRFVEPQPDLGLRNQGRIRCEHSHQQFSRTALGLSYNQHAVKLWNVGVPELRDEVLLTVWIRKGDCVWRRAPGPRAIVR